MEESAVVILALLGFLCKICFICVVAAKYLGSRQRALVWILVGAAVAHVVGPGCAYIIEAQGWLAPFWRWAPYIVRCSTDAAYYAILSLAFARLRLDHRDRLACSAAAGEPLA